MTDIEPSETTSKLTQSTRASERVSAQRKGSGRMFRTILLGTVAMVAGVLWLGDQYGVAREETIELLLTSGVFVLLLTAAGVFGALLIRLLRWLFSRRD